MRNALIPKSRVVEAACRCDFLSFVQWSFRVLQPAATLHIGWHHLAIAHHLELIRRGVIKRLAIAAPPRTLKSFMTSVAFPVFMLGHDPARQFVGISHGADLQTKFNNERRMIVTDPRYHELFPEMQILKNTETEFHTTQGGHCYARSAEGSLTGIGGDVLILDDYQKPLDVRSETKLASTNDLYYNTIASRINNQHTGAIVVVGQRLHPGDLIGSLLGSSEQWTSLILPAIAENEESVPIGPSRHHVRRVGDLLDPEQQSREWLESLKFRDLETYAAQYQQAPIPPGGYIIKRSHVQYCDYVPRDSSWVYIQSWDTASKMGEANSRSACLDILFDGHNYYIVRAIVGQWEYHDLQQLVLSRAEKKPNVVLIEDVGLGTALIATLKQRGVHVRAVKPTGDKKDRLLRQMAKFTNGQIFFLTSAPGLRELEAELFSFPASKRNDLVDALTQALDYTPLRYVLNDTVNQNYCGLIFSMPRR
jgi:predicted phage terminase large subunit-like protein